MKREDKRQGSISGKVTTVFAHRFVIESSDGQLLANIGSEAVGRSGLRRGDKVTLKGKRKRFEIKVTEIEKGAGKPIRIERKKSMATTNVVIIGILAPRSRRLRAKDTRSWASRTGSQGISRFLGAPPTETLPNSTSDLAEQSVSTSSDRPTRIIGSLPAPVEHMECLG
jgi:hypothetical protein